MKKTTTKKPAASRAKKAHPQAVERVEVLDTVADTTRSGDLQAQPPTHQPGVAVEPGLDPTTPPNAN